MPCSKCDDSGYLLSENRKIVDFCDCPIGKEKRTNSWNSIQASSGIFKEYWDKRLKDFHPQPMPQHQKFHELVTKTAANVTGLISTNFTWAIYGDEGSGKSLGAILVLKAALKKGFSCRYIVWSNLLSEKLNKKDEEESIVDKLKNTDFLCIDDLGRDDIRDESKFPNETLEDILKYRYSNDKPTILVLHQDFDTMSLKFSILRNLIKPENVSEVRGLNFRTQNQKGK